jgi:signal peptidase II
MPQMFRGFKIMKKPVILAGILFLFDQITKYLIDVFIPYGNSINIIPFFDLFNMTHVRNTGVAFSFFQGRNLTFTIFTAAVLAFFCVWLYRNRNAVSKLQMYAFCIVIAGGAGNMIDRIFRGAVVDFLDFGINALRWPSFNAADSCICVGAFLIIIDLAKPLFRKKSN